jgi:hypothetical protein
MIYLSLSVHSEERIRAQARGEDKVWVSSELTDLEDEWKN